MCSQGLRREETTGEYRFENRLEIAPANLDEIGASTMCNPPSHEIVGRVSKNGRRDVYACSSACVNFPSGEDVGPGSVLVRREDH